MRKIARLVIISILVLGTVVLAADTPNKILSLNKIMTKTEQDRAGISRLSANEKAALEAWLTDFLISIATHKSNVYLGIGQEHWTMAAN